MLADSISPGALKSEDEHRREICTAGRWIHGRAFVASTDGNISVRLDSRRILTSPTGISKGLMQPDDLVITDLKGQETGRPPRAFLGTCHASADLFAPSGRERRVPRAPAHCHRLMPPRGIPLNKAPLSELVISLGCIPVAEYGTPGTPELSESLEPLVQNFDAILMANHGVVT